MLAVPIGKNWHKIVVLGVVGSACLDMVYDGRYTSSYRDFWPNLLKLGHAMFSCSSRWLIWHMLACIGPIYIW